MTRFTKGDRVVVSVVLHGSNQQVGMTGVVARFVPLNDGGSWVDVEWDVTHEVGSIAGRRLARLPEPL